MRLGIFGVEDYIEDIRGARGQIRGDSGETAFALQAIWRVRVFRYIVAIPLQSASEGSKAVLELRLSSK